MDLNIKENTEHNISEEGNTLYYLYTFLKLNYSRVFNLGEGKLSYKFEIFKCQFSER